MGTARTGTGDDKRGSTNCSRNRRLNLSYSSFNYARHMPRQFPSSISGVALAANGKERERTDLPGYRGWSDPPLSSRRAMRLDIGLPE